MTAWINETTGKSIDYRTPEEKGMGVYAPSGTLYSILYNPPITKAQRAAVYRKWTQDSQGMTYRQFRRTVKSGYDCIMVEWCGMWLGIETDGYTHS